MTEITEDDIRRRAFAIWEADGRPDGNHDLHWQQAFQELTAEGEGRMAAKSAEPKKPSRLSVVENSSPAEPVKKRVKKIA